MQMEKIALAASIVANILFLGILLILLLAGSQGAASAPDLASVEKNQQDLRRQVSDMNEGLQFRLEGLERRIALVISEQEKRERELGRLQEEIGRISSIISAAQAERSYLERTYPAETQGTDDIRPAAPANSGNPSYERSVLDDGRIIYKKIQ